MVERETSREMLKENLKFILSDRDSLDSLDNLGDEVHFCNDLNMDSLDMVELVSSLESDYGFRVLDEDVAELRTVGKVLDYVQDNYRPISQ